MTRYVITFETKNQIKNIQDVISFATGLRRSAIKVTLFDEDSPITARVLDVLSYTKELSTAEVVEAIGHKDTRLGDMNLRNSVVNALHHLEDSGKIRRTHTSTVYRGRRPVNTLFWLKVKV